MFGMFKGTAKDAINRVGGTTDFLEGLCSACALMAGADGSIDPNEGKKALEIIKRKEGIDGKFDSRTIEREWEKRCAQTGDRSGRAELMTQIEQVVARDRDGVMGLALVNSALDVADSVGGIDEKEKTTGLRIAKACGVSEGDFQKMLDA